MNTTVERIKSYSECIPPKIMMNRLNHVEWLSTWASFSCHVESCMFWHLLAWGALLTMDRISLEIFKCELQQADLPAQNPHTCAYSTRQLKETFSDRSMPLTAVMLSLVCFLHLLQAGWRGKEMSKAFIVHSIFTMIADTSSVSN